MSWKSSSVLQRLVWVWYHYESVIGEHYSTNVIWWQVFFGMYALKASLKVTAMVSKHRIRYSNFILLLKAIQVLDTGPKIQTLQEASEIKIIIYIARRWGYSKMLSNNIAWLDVYKRSFPIHFSDASDKTTLIYKIIIQ